MRTYRFYKEHGIWFIDLKWFPKKWKHHLAMVAGADEMLDLISNQGEEVTLNVSTKPKNEMDIVLIRQVIFPYLFFGAVYQPFNFRIENEILRKNQLWLCWVTLLVFGRYPSKICFSVKG